MDDLTPHGYSTPGTPSTEDDDDDIYDPIPARLHSAARRTTTPSRKSTRSAGVATSPLRRRSAATPTKSPAKSRRTQSRRDPVHSAAAAAAVASPTKATDTAASLALGFVSDTLGIVVWLIRKPVAWGLAIAILYVLAGATWVWMRNSMYTALAPICGLPGMGIIGLPFCGDSKWDGDGGSGGGGGGGGGRRAGNSNFPKLMDLQASFEGVLENSVGGSVMAMDLKKSEIAVRDLNSLVKHSNLVCRDDLSNRLEEFVIAAKSTSHQLSRFSSRVGGVVDNLLAMDEYAISALKNVKAAQIAASSSSAGFKGLILAPFRSQYDLVAAERNVLRTFIQASTVMDTSIQRLIYEAETTLRELNELDNKLEVIQDIVEREKGMLDERTEDVLAQVWTKLGGNRRKLANFDSHKYLLSNIGSYRQRALLLVVKSLGQLQSMQTDLEELRDQVARPGLLEDSDVDQVPLEVHINTIRKGVNRLNDGMTKAKDREATYMRAVQGMAFKHLGAE